MSEYVLTREILLLSSADTWDAAKLEWTLDAIEFSDEAETCLCSHHPILELCYIRNRTNNRTTMVGNCCVKKFLGLPSDKIFGALKRVRRKVNTSLNEETIEYAYSHHWINDWERGFYFDTMRKRALSSKQASHRVEINEKVLRKMFSSPTN